VLNEALWRMFGMALNPRFIRTNPPARAEPEARFVAEWNEALTALVGNDGTAAVLEDGGPDDGFTLILVGSKGAWALHVDQAHD
jgi:hypothetical protein